MTEPSNEAVEAAAMTDANKTLGPDGVWRPSLDGRCSEGGEKRHTARKMLQAALPIERNRWEQEVRERLAPLLDDYTEAVEAFCRGERGASLRVNGLEKRILAIFGEAEPVEGRENA